HDRVRNIRSGLARKEPALLKERLQHARDGSEIRIILRMASGTHPEVGGPSGPQRVDTVPGPPLLQSTSRAHMAPKRDGRITAVLQPACEITQDRPEQRQRRISAVHPREQLDEHRSLQRAGADIGTAPDARRLVNVKSSIESAAILWARTRSNSTLL